MKYSRDFFTLEAGHASAASVLVESASWGPVRGRCILQPSSFELAPGQILGIVGANGAGKSTLLRLLYRYFKPLGGRVLVDARDIWTMKARDVARSVAVVLQEQPADLALKVRDIVTMGRLPHRSGLGRNGSADAEIVEAALHHVGLEDFGHRLIGTLSGGERQRAMIARALAQQPRLLIMDEPTNHLDIRHQLEVMALMRTLGPTIITSLHDINLAAGYCDKILMLAQGETLACGAPDDVLTEELISRSFGVQASRQSLQPSGDPHLTFQL